MNDLDKPAPVNQYAYRLQEEIQFWRRMIDQYAGNRDDAEILRMQEALALAEYRLLASCEARRSSHQH